ncbi:unnamed protein product [Blepharisma stoltei]|uniref:Uncharacterized protein n=1 Tax=Blepharisma stoltei TaxID=1481888 RepID=A0AAU9IGT9_9CILI|nr:unnamed protein product [Blepharisma stoltei]
MKIYSQARNHTRDEEINSRNNILRNSMKKPLDVKLDDYKSILKALKESICSNWKPTVIQPFELKTSTRSRRSCQTIPPSPYLQATFKSDTAPRPITLNFSNETPRPKTPEYSLILRKKHTASFEPKSPTTHFKPQPNLSIMKIRPGSCSPTKRVHFNTDSQPPSTRPSTSIGSCLKPEPITLSYLNDSFYSKEFPTEWEKISLHLKKGRSYTPVLLCSQELHKKSKISVKTMKDMHF